MIVRPSFILRRPLMSFESTHLVPIFFHLQTSRYLCPIWVTLRGPPNPRRDGRVLLVPISTPKGPSLLLPAPLYVAVVLYAPLVLAAGVSQSSGYLGVTAKERKIELLMHMLSIKHETNLLL